MTEPPPAPQRRQFQFTLRTLLILTTIVAAAFGWWSYKARQQREAVVAIQKNGGVVWHNPTVPWARLLGDTPRWPKWLMESAVVDYFANVYQIALNNSQVTDADLAPLENLPALRSLNLSNKQITDAGLEHLQGLTALTELNLVNTQVTDAGAARLHKSLPNCLIER